VYNLVSSFAFLVINYFLELIYIVYINSIVCVVFKGARRGLCLIKRIRVSSIV
jgi:hypothetical protein